ncbi:MAG: hypothetical protein AMXMBFR84_15720 [Candidatus Hydrogenedentota bacterium]
MTHRYTIDSLLEEIVTLPSLPDSVFRITEMVNSPDPNMHDIGKAISADPALALKTLRLVNSAYYGLANKVTSVEHAVTLLGLRVLKNLVFTATVFETFKTSTADLLRHSVACAVAMRTIAEARINTMEFDPEEAFIFGLLHDIGKIIFQQFLPEDFESAVHASHVRGIPLFIAEQDVIGVDHAELGACLAEKWGLPPALVQAVASHHDLSNCSDVALRPLAATLAVADYFCIAAGIPADKRSVLHCADGAFGAAKISNDQIPDLLNRFFRAHGSIDEYIQVAA